MKLYEITDAIERVINGGYAFNEETGEILFDASDLEALNLALADKLESCAIVEKNMVAEAAAIKAEEEALRDRRKRLERKAERLKDYVARCMEIADVRELSTPRVDLRFRKSSRVVVDDASVIPERLCRIKTEMKPDLTAIRCAIKAGETVPGAKIVTAENLSIG